ncbi:MAG: CPBP family intramembrane glutamic endopeptidase [archaeon]
MYISLILYGILLILAIHGVHNFKELGFRETRFLSEWKISLLGVFAIFLMSFLIIFVWYLIGFETDLSPMKEVIEKNNAAQILTILCVGSFVEEIFFRGFLLKRIGLVASSFIFAYFHVIYGSLGEVIVAFFAGLILGKIFILRKNIVAPILAHLQFNLLSFALAMLG